LLDPHEHVPKWFQVDISDGVSLAVVVGIIGISIFASMISARREAA
jgi:hypothetical protein